MRLLIDGDGFIYRCGFAVEKTKYLVALPAEGHDGPLYEGVSFDNHKEAKSYVDAHKLSLSDIWSRKEIEPVENALALVRGAMEALPDGEREVWLSPSFGNFRDAIAVSAKYKGNRDTAKRPVYFDEISAYLIGTWGATRTAGEEADDILGIRATALGENSCIVSFDKDLDQIPGMHYNWVTKEMYRVSPKDAGMNFYRQVLSGDRVDNVPGLDGIGAVKAAKLLEGVSNPREAWERALGAYKAAYGPVEGPKRALETARLVYVRRKEGEIWSPPE